MKPTAKQRYHWHGILLEESHCKSGFKAKRKEPGSWSPHCFGRSSPVLERFLWKIMTRQFKSCIRTCWCMIFVCIGWVKLKREDSLMSCIVKSCALNGRTINFFGAAPYWNSLLTLLFVYQILAFSNSDWKLHCWLFIRFDDLKRRRVESKNKANTNTSSTTIPLSDLSLSFLLSDSHIVHTCNPSQVRLVDWSESGGENKKQKPKCSLQICKVLLRTTNRCCSFCWWPGFQA